MWPLCARAGHRASRRPAIIFDLPPQAPPQASSSEHLEAHAEDASPPAVVVEAVIVTAARLSPARSGDAFSQARLDEADLAGAARVDEAVLAIPAVSLFRRTTSLEANPTTQGLSLRAIAPSGAGRALVTLDGVPLNDPFGGWVIWSQVASEALEGIAITRGAGAGPYGAGALTGTVALTERERGGALDASASGRGGRRLGGAWSAATGRLRLTASGLLDRNDGYVAVRREGRGDADQPLDLDVRSGALRLDGRLSGEIRASGRIGAYDERRGAGLEGARSRARGQLYSLALVRESHEGALGWRVQLWHHDSDLQNVSVTVLPGRTGTLPANDQFASPASGTGGSAALRLRRALAGGEIEAEAGVDVRRFAGEVSSDYAYQGGAFTRRRVSGGRSQVAGAYVDGAWSDGRWLVVAGVRADAFASSAGFRRESDIAGSSIFLDERFEGARGQVISARAGVRRELGQGVHLRAAAYGGFRPPTLNELYRPFRVGNDITESNDTLSPERLTGLEVGAGLSRGVFSATIGAFANRLDDAIVNVTLAEGPGTFPIAGFVPAGGVLRQRRNAGRIEALGVEGEMRWRIAGESELSLGFALTDAEVDGGDAAPQLTGLRPAQAPRLNVSASARLRPLEQMSATFTLRHESARFDDDLNSRILDAATTLDVRVGWTSRQGIEIYGALDNALDADVATSRTFDGITGFGPPRTLRIGLRWQR